MSLLPDIDRILLGPGPSLTAPRVMRAMAAPTVSHLDPLMLGLRRMAMIGVRTEGDTSTIAEKLRDFDDIDYLVITAGSFDLLLEVVVRDDGALLELTNRIRSVPGVRATETFIYLDLVKQTYSWGAR